MQTCIFKSSVYRAEVRVSDQFSTLQILNWASCFVFVVQKDPVWGQTVFIFCHNPHWGLFTHVLKIKGLGFILQALCRNGTRHHRFVFPPCIFYLYAIFRPSHWSPKNWAETQEPRCPCSPPSPISLQSNPFSWAVVLYPVRLVEAVLYKDLQVGEPWVHRPPLWAQTRRKTNVLPKRFATFEDCTVHLVLPVLPSDAVKICPCTSFPILEMLPWIGYKSIGFNVISA